jgi:hypothetical protein
MEKESVLLLCAALGLAILALGLGLALWQRRVLTRVLRILGGTVFLALAVGVYPTHLDDPHAVGLSLLDGMGALLLNLEPARLLAGLVGFSAPYLKAYQAVLMLLLIVAPLFTVGITLSFFADKFARLLYRVRSAFRDTYLFSAVNERTLSIAEDIAAATPRAVTVFAVGQEAEGVCARDLARLKAIGAVLLPEDVTEIRHSLRHVRNYYLLDTDSGVNLEAGLRLYRKYNGKKTDRVNMWLYTKSEITEVVFDHLYETFNVRLINEEALISRALVTEHPLYGAVEEGRLSVLLVGGGNIGLEILRTVTACSFLGDGVRAELAVIDLDAERTREVLEKTSPALAERFGIRFFSADVRCAAFYRALDAVRPTYVVISLGNETRNIETALEIRRRYGNRNGYPRIHVLVDHRSAEEEILPQLSVSDWRYDPALRRFGSTPIADFEIRAFGSFEDTYRGLRIGAAFGDCLAIAVNAVNLGIYEADETNTKETLIDLYNQVGYYKEYSDAYAVSIPYKLDLLGLRLSDDGAGDLSLLEERLPSSLDVLRRQEGYRYEAFMRSKGWRQMTAEEIGIHGMRDKLGKKYARLDGSQTALLEAVTGRDFAKEDGEALLRLPAVIRLAGDLFGRAYSVRERK